MTLTDWKQQLWERYPTDMGNKGSKAQFTDQLKKLKPDEKLQTEIGVYLREKIITERKLLNKGEFVSRWPAWYLMIKRRFWEDDLLCVSNPALNPQTSCVCALCRADVSIMGMSAKTPKGQLCCDCFRKHYADLGLLRTQYRKHNLQNYTPKESLDLMRKTIKGMLL